jgi:hypothetical protein
MKFPLNLESVIATIVTSLVGWHVLLVLAHSNFAETPQFASIVGK